MGKNDPISGTMAGSRLPQNVVKNFSRKRIDGIRRGLGLSGRQKRRYRARTLICSKTIDEKRRDIFGLNLETFLFELLQYKNGLMMVA
jgi:hypothetical protein